MIVRVWDPIHCVLRLTWRTAAQAARLKPLVLGTVLVCGGGSPPPPPLHPPAMPPPGHVVPPPPPIPVLPPIVPGIWTGTPPIVPIPLAPVQPQGGITRISYEGTPSIESDLRHAAGEQFWSEDTPSRPEQPCVPDTPKNAVSEPGALSVFLIGLIILGIWHVLGKYER